MEFQELIKKRNHRYGKVNIVGDDKVPDFERQLTHAFNLKYQRADSLGVRNLIIDENQIMRASRPNMDKLIVLGKLKHEVRNPNQIQIPLEDATSVNQDDPFENVGKKFEDIDFEKEKLKLEHEEICKPPLLNSKITQKR
jgi:hypothetical protein